MQRLLLRFVFGAAISVVAGLVTLTLGPVAGGVFLAFPAILPATLTLLERDKGTVAACDDARGAVAGALGLIAFAVIVVVLGHRTTAAATLVAALAAWIGASTLVYVAGVATARLLGVKRYPPEVPVTLVEPLIQLLQARRLSLLVVDAGAGGALSAVLGEVKHHGGAIRGAIVTPDARSACALAGVPQSSSSDSASMARRLAVAAKARWGGDIAAALIGERRHHPAKGETYDLAVATPSRTLTHRFDAHRGREGNWGEAVLLSVRFLSSVVTDEEAGNGRDEPGTARRSARQSLRSA
jgi:nicotinamide mononucleotide (NMN) deamidase PncC